MSQQGAAAVAASFPDVAEILEHILLYLGHETIVRITGVCKFWSNCVAGSKPLLRKIYRLPALGSDDSNPHFVELTEAARDATVPQFDYQGQNLWNLVRDIEDTFLDRTHDLPPEEYKTRLQYDHDNDEPSAGYRFWRLRACFMNIRYPNGWPPGLQQLHCDLCDHWHTDFRYENLHPLLRFLGEVTCCFRGNSKQLFFDIALVSTKQAPKSCWEHSREEALTFAKCLLKAYKAVQARGVANDLFINPPATKLVNGGRWCVEDDDGLTLEKVLPLIFQIFWGELSEWRDHCHAFETKHTCIRRSRRTERDGAAAFPTTEDWNKHLSNYSDINRLWQTTIGEVDKVLAEVPSWKPLLAEEVEEPTWDVYAF